MDRKSQMELFGIAVIIVIVTIAFFFYIGTKLRKTSSPGEGFADIEVSQRFIDAILNTRTECRATVSEIIRDCTGKNDMCGGNSCEYAKETLKNSIDATLGKWKKSYRLTVTAGASSLIELESGCTDDMEKEAPGIQPIPGNPPILVKLEICKKFI